ncbi:ferredoxin reductase [Aestuariimicrobium ganziense]|uniref:ferredoxin reductase n=1 Tax=Aestuariimicrobium ganziense TaxID=2773677 RepID=UPI002E29652D|nr:ferredoxin reductase [Aestuariimicrobium ganziense]
MTSRSAALSRLIGRAAWGLGALVATPVLPDDYVALVNPLQARDVLRARVLAKMAEGVGVATLVLRPSRSWTTHRPGQYLRIGVDIAGVRHWRAYSVTSPPGARELTITVKAKGDGLVSTHLVERARPGDVIMLDLATGDFVLPETLPDKLLFLTAGSGITPVMAMLRAYRFGDVVVLHSARSADDVIFGDELRSAAAEGQLVLLERHTDAQGRLDPTELDDLVPDWRERETYACGPAELLAGLEAHFEAAGVADRLHVERFQTEAAAVGEGGTARFVRSGVEVETDGATTLLQAGEDAGVLLKSGCRMGICFSCVTKLTAGSVRDLRTGETTTVHDEPIHIQTCVSASAGACQLDA